MHENNKFIIIYSDIKMSIFKNVLILKLFTICNSFIIHACADLSFIMSCI